MRHDYSQAVLDFFKTSLTTEKKQQEKTLAREELLRMEEEGGVTVSVKKRLKPTRYQRVLTSLRHAFFH